VLQYAAPQLPLAAEHRTVGWKDGHRRSHPASYRAALTFWDAMRCPSTQPGETFMKTLLVIAVALTTVAAAPAFAASYRGAGYERNDNVNRGDFQLSGARWKTNHKHHRAPQASK
jgi:hypothetical protein